VPSVSVPEDSWHGKMEKNTLILSRLNYARIPMFRVFKQKAMPTRTSDMARNMVGHRWEEIMAVQLVRRKHKQKL